MKPLIVGEASNLASGRAFEGRSGASLAKLCGLTLDEFLVAFDRVNLLRRCPGRRPGAAKGHRFDLARARGAASELDLVGRVVVLAGKRVAAAFGLTDPPWLRSVWLGRGEVEAFVIPHPSGIVRWWNDAGNRRRAARLLRGIVRRFG